MILKDATRKDILAYCNELSEADIDDIYALCDSEGIMEKEVDAYIRLYIETGDDYGECGC